MNGRKPKLSPESAAKLRELRQTGEFSDRALGRMFRMDTKTVRRYASDWHKHPEVRMRA